MEEYNVLTKDEIIDKLKSMEVGEGKCPWKTISFVYLNPNYDPNTFSQEIEDTEEEINLMEEFKKWYNAPGFDWVWCHPYEMKRNSDKWYANHTKICKINFAPMQILLQCAAQHRDGTRNYYSENNVKRIMEWGEKHGKILNFG